MRDNPVLFYILDCPFSFISSLFVNKHDFLAVQDLIQEVCTVSRLFLFVLLLASPCSWHKLRGGSAHRFGGGRLKIHDQQGWQDGTRLVFQSVAKTWY